MWDPLNIYFILQINVFFIFQFLRGFQELKFFYLLRSLADTTLGPFPALKDLFKIPNRRKESSKPTEDDKKDDDFSRRIVRIADSPRHVVICLIIKIYCFAPSCAVPICLIFLKMFHFKPIIFFLHCLPIGTIKGLIISTF